MVVVLCLNGGILMTTYLSGQTLVTPFNTSISVTGINTTAIYPANLQSGIAQNVTSNVYNSTSGSGTLLNQISSNAFFVLSILWVFWQFISGGFIFNVLGIFGFPVIFIQIVISVLVIYSARSAVYYFTGR